MSQIYSCILCNNLCDNQQISLTTGKLLHHTCHDGLKDQQSKCSDLILKIKSRNVSLAEKLRHSSSLFYKLRRVIGGEVINIEACQREINENKSNLEKVSKKRDEISEVLTVIYDYWPSYPPDWEDRKKLARSGIRACEHCHSSRNVLHVHHRRPISRGGTHKLENLIVICEKCHSKAHGGQHFDYNDKITESPFERKLNVLRAAITSSQMVHFSYTRRDGRQSIRTMLPQGFKTVENSSCVHGYCYLRKEQRTFAISRMNSLSVVTDPGENHHKKRKRA